MTEVLEKMNAGIWGRRAGTGTIFGEWENAPQETGGVREELVNWWKENARERDWDERGFALVTKEAWDDGRVVFVNRTEKEESSNETLVDVESVGEILVWLYVGFILMSEVTRMHRDGDGGIKGLLKKRVTE